MAHICDLNYTSIISSGIMCPEKDSLLDTWFFFLIFIYLAALGLSCGMWDLVPWPGIEPGPTVLGEWSLSYWTPAKSQDTRFIRKIILQVWQGKDGLLNRVEWTEYPYKEKKGILSLCIINKYQFQLDCTSKCESQNYKAVRRKKQRLSTWARQGFLRIWNGLITFKKW